jgi:hypothetical protein
LAMLRAVAARACLPTIHREQKREHRTVVH